MKIIEYMKKNDLMQDRGQGNIHKFNKDHEKVRTMIKATPRTKNDIGMELHISRTAVLRHVQKMMCAGELWETRIAGKEKLYHWRTK